MAVSEQFQALRARSEWDERHEPQSGVPALLHTVMAWSAGVRNSAASFIKALQLGRMVNVLNGLSDEQLDQVGISRADIPAYAKRMVLED